MNCAYCPNEAVFYCRVHRRHLCASTECSGPHGWHRTAVRPELCEFVDPVRIDWIDALVGVGSLMAVAAIAYTVWVHWR